ncbi:MAG: DoxX family protein [Ilumatobacteraceae bacterium]
MSDADAVDLVLFVFRCGIGAVIATHGVNHIGLRGEKIAGTAGWFGSMGMRPPLAQAWLASIAEIGAGLLLVLGLLTPFGAGTLLGVMAVAFVIAHRDKGFFIFNPGQGWEYVATLGLCALAIGTVGPGAWSVDAAIDLDLTGSTGLVVTTAAGFGGAVVLLAACWRPERAA